MIEPTFDQGNLEDCRLSIDCIAGSYQTAKDPAGANRHTRKQWPRAAPAIPLNIAAGNGKQNLKDSNRFFEFARGSALKCAAICDMLKVSAAVDEEPNHTAKLQLRRIVLVLTTLIRRLDRVVGVGVGVGVGVPRC